MSAQNLHEFALFAHSQLHVMAIAAALMVPAVLLVIAYGLGTQRSEASR